MGANEKLEAATHGLTNHECAVGKHGNCWGDALDPKTDQFVPCTCTCHADLEPHDSQEER